MNGVRMPRKRLRPPGNKGDQSSRQLWRLIDGALIDAMNFHPEYFTATGSTKTARASLVKRVAGTLKGYASKGAWGRSGAEAGG